MNEIQEYMKEIQEYMKDIQELKLTIGAKIGECIF
jgi:hypothetical protein